MKDFEEDKEDLFEEIYYSIKNLCRWKYAKWNKLERLLDSLELNKSLIKIKKEFWKLDIKYRSIIYQQLRVSGIGYGNLKNRSYNFLDYIWPPYRRDKLIELRWKKKQKK